jgi:hypothetical protein
MCSEHLLVISKFIEILDLKHMKRARLELQNSLLKELNNSNSLLTR